MIDSGGDWKIVFVGGKSIHETLCFLGKGVGVKVGHVKKPQCTLDVGVAVAVVDAVC